MGYRSRKARKMSYSRFIGINVWKQQRYTCCIEVAHPPVNLRYNECTSMIPGRIRCELALVAALCVLLIFFFPSIKGSYSSVHGPVTALLALRAAARLRIAIVQSALNSLGNRLISTQVVLSRISLPNAEFQLLSLPQYNTILRC